MHNGINTGGVFGHIFDFTGIPVAARAILALAVCIVLTTALLLAGFFMAKFKMHPFISNHGEHADYLRTCNICNKGVSWSDRFCNPGYVYSADWKIPDNYSVLSPYCIGAKLVNVL